MLSQSKPLQEAIFNERTEPSLLALTNHPKE